MTPIPRRSRRHLSAPAAALTQAARGFTQKAREGSSPENLREAADTVMGEHQRVCRALANLYPDLAA